MESGCSGRQWPSTRVQIVVKVGDLLEESADAILTTANPWLNMSGGVNGAIRMRGNPQIQEELHGWLAARGLKALPPASVVRTDPGNLSARHLLHGVAITAFYESSSDIVRQTVEAALARAVELDCVSVAMPMLATGYGPLKPPEFAAGLKPLAGRAFGRIATLTVVVRKIVEKEQIDAVLGPS